MLDETKNDYVKTAQRFLRKRLPEYSIDQLTPDVLRVSFDLFAKEVSPGYWSKNRLAMCYYLSSIGKGKDDLVLVLDPDEYRNPETQSWQPNTLSWKHKSDGKPGKKQRRVKSISNDEFSALSAEAARRENRAVQYALIIVAICGCRPSEIHNISVINDKQFMIASSKKITSGDNKGKRGLDRMIKIENPTHAELFSRGIQYIQVNEVNISNVQKTVWSIAKSLWPKRKHRPSLYSLRHQLGSNLKASGLSREETAYLMGHRCTSSVDKYGDRRSGKGKVIRIKSALCREEIMKMVKTDHLTDNEIEAKKGKIAKEYKKKILR